MDLIITFEPKMTEPSGSRLVIAVGEAIIRSYPMDPDDHYRDLFALKHFLKQRTLKNIVLGDEPVGEVAFLGYDDLVALRPYKRWGKTISSAEFNLAQALSQIDHNLMELTSALKNDRDTIERHVKDDIDAGVYD